MNIKTCLMMSAIIVSAFFAKAAEVKYSYDELGRLSEVSYVGKEKADEFYSYDERGNLSEKRIGEVSWSYEYDRANQIASMEGPDGTRTYKYDNAGRLLEEHLDGKLDVSYKYGYLDKVIEINRNGAVTKFNYDGMGMLVEKILPDGKSEKWVWDGMALVARGDDIYVNEAHIAGGTPILTKTDKGIRYHASDFLGTTLWSSDMKGNIVDSYADTSVFGEGSIQHDRSARFTGKPYDEDLQAFVFPFRNYKPDLARWTSSDPAGFPDGINSHYYAAVPTMDVDPLGLWVLIEYWSISKVFKYKDMGNAPFPGMDGMSSGSLDASDSGASSASSVFSGHQDGNGNNTSGQHEENKGPIPDGNYYVGNQKSNGWYSLYGKTSSGDYSYTNIPVNNPDGGTSNRGGFNLHNGTRSDGCVTVKDGGEWNNIENMLNNTSPIAPFPNKPTDTYKGILIVVEK